MTYTKNQCINLLEQNNHDQPKAKYSNNVLLQMLQMCDNKSKFSVEKTRDNFELNRGSLCECIVKRVLGLTSTKASKGLADIDLTGLDRKALELPIRAKKLEIKFATSFANASANQPATKYVMLVTKNGAYLLETANHQANTVYKPRDIEQGYRLNVISEMLGL